ncbi:hypothetical protein FKM82_008189 [Ascaphus truei]
MNLFCFTLEGSMDNLYEPVQNNQDSKENSISRASSPLNSITKIVQPERSLSLELSDVDSTDAQKKRKKSLIQKSMSENEAFDTKTWTTTYWYNSRRGDNDSYLRRHCHIEDLSEDDFLIGDRINLLSRKKAEENLCQIPSYEQWIPPRIQSANGSANEMALDDNKSETMGTLKRLQKLVRSKKGNVNDDVKHALLPLTPAQDTEEGEEETLTTCMKLTKSQDKKTCKVHPKKKQETENFMELNSTSSERSSNAKWSTIGNVANHSQNTSQLFADWKSFPDNHFDPFLFSIAQIEEWKNCTCCNHHLQLPSSLTDMDLPHSWGVDFFSCKPL